MAHLFSSSVGVKWTAQQCLLEPQISLLGIAAAASPDHPSSCKRCFYNIVIDVSMTVRV